MRVTKKQVYPPAPGLPRVALLVHPLSMGQVSKVGENDESVLISRPWIGRCLLRQARGQPDSPLFDANIKEMKAAYEVVLEELGLGKKGLVLYNARHSGASLDHYYERYSLTEVAKRGRWRSMASVRRYEKKALLQAMWRTLSKDTKAKCVLAAQHFPDLLTRLFNINRKKDDGARHGETLRLSCLSPPAPTILRKPSGRQA